MKTNEIKVVVNGAKNEIKSVKKSPLFYFHLLEKLAKKQMKLDNDTTDLAELLKLCGGKFTFDSVDIDKSGRLSKRVKYAVKKHYGFETIETYLGMYALVPCALSEIGILNSIKAKLEYREAVRTDLSSTKVKKAQKVTKSELLNAYLNGLISGNEFAQRYAEIAA